MRKTKIVCTIGPKTNSYENLVELAKAGMNIARLNMSHGEHKWHSDVIKAVKRINEKGSHSIAIMLDTKGPEVRSGDLKTDLQIESGERFTFTTEHQPEYPEGVVDINYDSFHEDVEVGDVILIDGGMLTFEVQEIIGHDVNCVCIDGGVLSSRRHVNVRGRSANLPSITKKDWNDIKFGVDQGVDYIALSFVKHRDAVDELKKFLKENKHPVDVISKIESAQAMDNIEGIVEASDGIMVARGDLGAELPIEDVPVIQDRLIRMSRDNGKPVIVATQLLESMMINPTPTRAEVSDIAKAVSEKSDCIMLSGETAMGRFANKTVNIMDIVSRRIEKTFLENPKVTMAVSDDPNKEIVRSAAILANNLEAKGILVFTRSGFMASLVAQSRPNSPIYAFTNTSHVRRRMNIMWGVYPVRIDFSKTPEKTINRSFNYLVDSGQLKEGDRVILISDIIVENKFVQTVQIRNVEILDSPQ